MGEGTLGLRWGKPPLTPLGEGRPPWGTAGGNHRWGDPLGRGTPRTADPPGATVGGPLGGGPFGRTLDPAGGVPPWGTLREAPLGTPPRDPTGGPLGAPRCSLRCVRLDVCCVGAYFVDVVSSECAQWVRLRRKWVDVYVEVGEVARRALCGGFPESVVYVFVPFPWCPQVSSSLAGCLCQVGHGCFS